MIIEKQTTKLLDNAIPIYNYICEMNNIKIHNMSKYVKNLGGIIKFIKTDCIEFYYENNNTKITNFLKNDLQKCDWKISETNNGYIEMLAYYKRTYDSNYDDLFIKKEYNILYKDNGNDNFKNVILENNLLKKSFMLNCLAGTGKTHFLNTLKRLTEEDTENEYNIKTITPTNISALLCDGETINKFFNSKQSDCKNITHLIVDEISMINDVFLNILGHLQLKNPNMHIIISGDFSQLQPVCDRLGNNVNYYNSQIIKELCKNNIIELTKCRRANDKLFNIYKSASEGKQVDISEFGKNICLTNICVTNEKGNK